MANYESKPSEVLKTFKHPVAGQTRQEEIAVIDVDPASPNYKKIVEIIPLPPDYVAHHTFYSRDSTKAYVTSLGKSELSVIDTTKGPFAIKQVAVPDCKIDEDVVFSADNRRWFLNCLSRHGQRDATHWEHLNELYAYLGLRPFRRGDEPTIARFARAEAIGTDRGDAIVGAMVSFLRQDLVVLPAATELERIALTARAQVCKQVYRLLVDGLSATVRVRLSEQIEVAEDRRRTQLAWLRDRPEAPAQRNLASIVERRQVVRSLGVEPKRKRRVHRARYAVIARGTASLSTQHLSRLESERRLATLVVFAREMEAELTDAAITMFDK